MVERRHDMADVAGSIPAFPTNISLEKLPTDSRDFWTNERSEISYLKA